VIDSPTVRPADIVPRADSGYDGEKKIRAAKRRACARICMLRGRSPLEVIFDQYNRAPDQRKTQARSLCLQGGE
jgi:hypothetical protein